jgi:hypothetical protein
MSTTVSIVVNLGLIFPYAGGRHVVASVAGNAVVLADLSIERGAS